MGIDQVVDHLLDDPTWKDYLSQRYQLTRQLAGEVHQHATEDPDRPRWAEDLVGLDPTLIADMQQWRATTLSGRAKDPTTARPRSPHQPGRNPRMAPEDHRRRARVRR